MPISPELYARASFAGGLTATLRDFLQNREARAERKEQRADRQLSRDISRQNLDLQQQRINAATTEQQNEVERKARIQKAFEDSATPGGLDLERAQQNLIGIGEVELAGRISDELRKRDSDTRAAETSRLGNEKTKLETEKLYQDMSRTPAMTANPIPVVGPDGKIVYVKREDAVGQSPAPTSTGSPVQVLGPDGKPVYTSPADAIGKSPVPPREPQGATSPIAVIGPNGEPVYVAPSNAIGQRPANIREQGPSTGAQKRVLNFFNRAKNASEELENLETWLGGLKLPGQTRLEYAPNVAQSPQGRQYIAAQRAFTEARLRKDSGAAIPEQEYTNDRRTYFPQPGDDAKTLAQKKRARAAVLASLAFESGAALKEFYGDEAEGMIADFRSQSEARGGGKVRVKGKDGIPYEFPNQEAADAFKKAGG